jgi:hypothetical protein
MKVKEFKPMKPSLEQTVGLKASLERNGLEPAGSAFSRVRDK